MSNIPSQQSQQQDRKRILQPTTGSIPLSAPPPQLSHTPGLLPQSPFANPYQQQYSTDPSAFGHGFSQQHHIQQQHPFQHTQMQAHHAPTLSPTTSRKRRISDIEDASSSMTAVGSGMQGFGSVDQQGMMGGESSTGMRLGLVATGPQSQAMGGTVASGVTSPVAKKGRTNTPWTPVEEQRLKTMRDAGNTWSEIAKNFPSRTEGSVKKHWYKDMHYADFTEDESATLLAAIKEYDASKWKAIGLKVGKPAKACEQYAREHFNKG